MRPTDPLAFHVRTVAAVCLRGVLLIALVFAVDRASAAGKVYRCGNVFQDRPCETATVEPAKPAEKPGPPAPVVRAPARPAVAVDRPVAEAPREMVITARR